MWARPASQACDAAPLEDRPTALVVSGGVSQNEALRARCDTVQYDSHLRRFRSDALSVLPLVIRAGGLARLTTLCRQHGLIPSFPPPRWCTDNGVMIAWAGVEWLLSGRPADAHTIDYRPRWPLESIVQDLPPHPTQHA